MMVESVGSPTLWVGFTLLVLFLLGLDLGIFHRSARRVGTKEALLLSAFWIGLALLFNAAVWRWFGPQRGLEFLTGYLLEKALSVDNLFVFIVIFSYFGVPPRLQHRILFWGILGALVMRAIFILAGAALLQSFHGVIYLFGGFLVYTGFKLLFVGDEAPHPERNPLVRLFSRYVPMTDGFAEGRFVVREGGRWRATPTLLALVAVEATDIVFAVDSIPAIFAVTDDPFIVYSSNIFAILGLRALYFALADLMESLRYLKVGLALALLFVGVKMLLSGVFPIPIEVSLGVVALLLAGSALASRLLPGGRERP